MLSYWSAWTLGVRSDGGYLWKTARNLYNRGHFAARFISGMKRSECELEETLSNRAQGLPQGGSAHRVAVGLLQWPWHLDCHQLRGSPEGGRVCVHTCVHWDSGRDQALRRLLPSHFSIMGWRGWERRSSSSCGPTASSFLCADYTQWDMYNTGAGFHEKERHKNAGAAPN